MKNDVLFNRTNGSDICIRLWFLYFAKNMDENTSKIINKI